MAIAELIEELLTVLPACVNAELPTGADFHVCLLLRGWHQINLLSPAAASPPCMELLAVGAFRGMPCPRACGSPVRSRLQHIRKPQSERSRSQGELCAQSGT